MNFGKPVCESVTDWGQNLRPETLKPQTGSKTDLRCLEPHERKSVYVHTSSVTGAQEGLFVRRTFLPGDLVRGGLKKKGKIIKESIV